jgi:anti-sigma factor RsiW
MTCQELTEFIASYLDGELPDEQRRVFDRHLSVCPDCCHYLDAYRKTIDLTKSTYVEPAVLREQMPDALVQAILRASRD